MRERRQIAADLHDDVGQLVTLTRIKLSALRKTCENQATQAGIADLMKLVDEVNLKIRSLTFQVIPPVLQDLGLVKALDWLAEEMLRVYGLKVAVRETAHEPELEESLRFVLFRSVRELLMNVAKHAEASLATVTIASRRGELVITVKDNGRGFDPDAREKDDGKQGWGLRSIRERMQWLGGRFKVHSAPRRGARIELIVPAPPPPEAPDTNRRQADDRSHQGRVGGRPPRDDSGPAVDPGEGNGREGGRRGQRRARGGRDGRADQSRRGGDGHRDAGPQRDRGGAADPGQAA
jgi:glucose-6-phosphate-specific signal transduction histidine kinase